jgi:hypothetical protein
MSAITNDHAGYTPPSALLLAGLAAGMAEIVWIALYAAFTPLEAADVARSITATFQVGSETGAWPVVAGLGIHFVLSVAVAGVFIALVYEPLREFLGTRALVACALGLLATIWVANFFVVLPAVNPGFVELMPMPVTLVSKLLFGLLLALALLRASPAQNR